APTMPSEPEEKPMTLDETLLQNLAKWRPNSQRPSLELAHQETGCKAVLTADAVDALASRLWEVNLSRLSPLAGQDDLAERAARVAARVTGLLEPLRLVETDAGLGKALLRSSAPKQRGDERLYYEVLLHADGSANVRRYQASMSACRRQQVPF